MKSLWEKGQFPMLSPSLPAWETEMNIKKNVKVMIHKTTDLFLNFYFLLFILFIYLFFGSPLLDLWLPGVKDQSLNRLGPAFSSVPRVEHPC